MRGTLLVGCLFAGGCDVVFRLDNLRDAAPDSSEGCFQPRKLVQSVGGSHDPTLSEDGLELFFVRGGVGTYDIWRAERATTADEFPMGTPVAELLTTSEETDPALTADGKTLVFKSNRNSQPNRAWTATRSGRGLPFGAATPVAGLTSMDVVGLDISLDGLTIYFDDFAKLNVATRPALTAAFETPRMVAIDRTQYPSVSPDGLELIYSAGGVLRRTRASTDEPFENPMVIDSGGSDADIAPDNTRFVMAGGGGEIYERERCP
ncbi:MAG TPA: hypothetical protein VIV11_04155 [Kofleriaceae bacterium]